jgi:hypothetical protein
MDASLALDATLNGSMLDDGAASGLNGSMGAAAAAAFEAQRRYLNTTLMPEYAVPYALHLLAHHPDFPDDPSDAPRVKAVEKHLRALLEPLIASLGAEADNVSFLLQMFDLVMQHDDALGGDAARTLLLCSIGKKCLKKMIKNPENVKPYPGHIYLPVALYRHRGGDGNAQLQQTRRATKRRRTRPRPPAPSARRRPPPKAASQPPLPTPPPRRRRRRSQQRSNLPCRFRWRRRRRVRRSRRRAGAAPSRRGRPPRSLPGPPPRPPTPRASSRAV